jgi:protein-L-isoaspartate(D-aspartate) O-methyltransferase
MVGRQVTDAHRTGIGMTSARTRERLIGRLRNAGISDERVLEAMRTVPRHLFIEEALAHRAYEDTALPIGLGQTISQPYTVARMTEILIVGNPQRVLEIGTGSGYQTAVLCALKLDVFSIERLEPLHKAARRSLQQAGLRNYRLQLGDGFLGWPEYGPYDAILIAAAAPTVPPALLDQLAPHGRLVMPVGNAERQELILVRRTAEGDVTEKLEIANFVPLVRGGSR